jgi:hypothetical protein
LFDLNAEKNEINEIVESAVGKFNNKSRVVEFYWILSLNDSL